VSILQGWGRRAARRPLALAAAACVIVAVLLAADASRPPSRQLTARAALGAIRWYQVTVSPRIGAQCRFTPTCSTYGAAVIRKHGLLRGGWLTAKRIARCGPWTPMGTVDRPE
jgi:uncharacterized protein